MNYSRLHIDEFLQQNMLFLDVRSPAEYQHAHIPGAISFPLFDDEERKIVGTTYKQVSREAAIKVGLAFFGPKMRKMVEEAERILADRLQVVGLNEESKNTIHNSEIRIYCWRGGMRSAAVAWLLSMYGFKVSVLIGGYKSFRNLILKTFEQPFPLQVLGGFTGSGKTEVLHYMAQGGGPVINLEAIACHKGSAFGNIGMPEQPTQEMFENLLGLQLMAFQNEPRIWVEDESQRIGTVNIPGGFWQRMRQAPVYFLDIPFEERLKHIVEEYAVAEKQILHEAIERISKRLGGLETKNALAYLDENNIEACFAILLKYYDKHYLKGLHNRENLDQLLTRINCENVSSNNAHLLMNKPSLA